MTKKEILNTPEIVDFMIDKSVVEVSRMKLHKRLEELCKLAIKALEQESCEDVVSRKEVKEQMLKYGFHAPDITVTEFVEYLPPVNPQEPCEDCISREAVINAVCAWGTKKERNSELMITMAEVKQSISDILADLPSVTPKYTDEEIDRAQAVEQAYVKKMVELTVEELKRPKGKWISHREHCENLGAMPNGLGAYQWCSNCDCAIDIREWQRNHYNFCPNCGADMRESEDKE